jgi:hypothetical protein
MLDDETISDAKAVRKLEQERDNTDTICAVHMALWRHVKTLPEGDRELLQPLIVKGFQMGWRMWRRLVFYKDQREGY